MIYELLEKVAPNSTTTITSSDSLSSDSLSSDSLSMDDIFAELANCCDYDDVESNNSETYSDKIKNSIKDLQNKLSDYANFLKVNKEVKDMIAEIQEFNKK